MNALKLALTTPSHPHPLTLIDILSISHRSSRPLHTSRRQAILSSPSAVLCRRRREFQRFFADAGENFSTSFSDFLRLSPSAIVCSAAKGGSSNNRPITGVVFEPFEEVKKEPMTPNLSLTNRSRKELSPDGIYRLVDVRDVANAHILAFENPEANGRYCMVGAVTCYSEIMKILDELYPALGHSESIWQDGKS
ncbi:hypothetical protein L6452_05324 [Arctium lappa]|uniref:Uncharacterized protein n=1 Tax=Arctium lappa TaxID=4217 RepID=A0ACB9EH54_ARCLA|nr:hypothetical protein L6452_05324 [Arctium lappa]